MEVANVDLAKELGLDIKIENKKLVLAVKYDGKGADATVMVEVEAAYFLDKLAAAIPGTLDDSVIAAIKLAL